MPISSDIDLPFPFRLVRKFIKLEPTRVTHHLLRCLAFVFVAGAPQQDCESRRAVAGGAPLDSQPAWLRTIMQASPSTHFVSFAQAILYRGAEFQDVWPRFLAVALIGALFLAMAVMRFRRVAEQAV
jgi:hypothetical protein